MSTQPRPWIDAWQDALYGPDGFYRRAEGPAGHFATSAQGVPGVDEVLAQTVLALAERINAEVVVDFACGRGELATSLLPFVEHTGAEVPRGEEAITDAAAPAGVRPKSAGVEVVGVEVVGVEVAGTDAQPVDVPALEVIAIEVIAVDVVERPATLDRRITWVPSPGGADVAALDIIAGRRALVIAHEWLDVVPCVIAEADDAGSLRQVLVTPDGSESLGAPLAAADSGWADTHSPATDLTTAQEFTLRREPARAASSRFRSEESTRRTPGERVEIGRTRDAAWNALVAEVRRNASAGSVVVGVDYGFTAATRNPLGTLTGFREGSECPPTPDGSSDITSHVAVDSLDVDTVTTQRDLVLDLFGSDPLLAVPIELATSDPRGYLARLATRSALATAVHPDGLGGFFWFTKAV